MNEKYPIIGRQTILIIWSHYCYIFLLTYTTVIPTITNAITIISIVMKIMITLTTTGTIIFDNSFLNNYTVHIEYPLNLVLLSENIIYYYTFGVTIILLFGEFKLITGFIDSKIKDSSQCVYKNTQMLFGSNKSYGIWDNGQRPLTVNPEGAILYWINAGLICCCYPVQK